MDTDAERWSLFKRHKMSGWELWTLSLSKAQYYPNFHAQNGPERYSLTIESLSWAWASTVRTQSLRVLAPRCCVHLLLLVHTPGLPLLAESLQQPFNNLFWEAEKMKSHLPTPHATHVTFQLCGQTTLSFSIHRYLYLQKGANIPTPCIILRIKLFKAHRHV